MAALTAKPIFPIPITKLAKNGLADLTAHYFWGKDFSTLDNNVLDCRHQQPHVLAEHDLLHHRVGAEISGSLTWNQINNYQAAWLAGKFLPCRHGPLVTLT